MSEDILDTPLVNVGNTLKVPPAMLTISYFFLFPHYALAHAPPIKIYISPSHKGTCLQVQL